MMLSNFLSIIGFLFFAVVSLTTYFGVKHDQVLHSDQFMQVDLTRMIPPSLRGVQERHVASKDQGLIKIQYFPYSKNNISRIQGKWKIYNYINEFDQEEKLNVSVELDLVGNSKVMIDQDANQIFRISLITEQDRMALVRKKGKSYEILELEKIKSAEEKLKSKIIASSVNEVKTDQEKSKGIFLFNGDLYLNKATNPTKSQMIYKNDLARGSIRINDGAINNFEVTLTLETGEILSLDFTFAQINDGGQFEFDNDGEQVSGIITNNGKDAFRVRFSTGKMAGYLLNFVTEEKQNEERELEELRIQELEEKLAEQQSQEGENNQLVQESFQRDQMNIQDLRSIQATAEAQNLSVSSEAVSPEEMAARLQNSTFNFSQDQTQNSAAENEDS